uniref:Uncharacterized protein n=1 Tax=Anguilla anguilla TaxID=7936 RepID=A0A0E9TWM4_ANGAN
MLISLSRPTTVNTTTRCKACSLFQSLSHLLFCRLVCLANCFFSSHLLLENLCLGLYNMVSDI